MARGYSTRKLEVWSLHAHRDGAPVDYETFFRDFAQAAAVEPLVWTSEDRLVAISGLEAGRETVSLVAYEGAPEERPLILDVARGAERDAELRQGEIVATKTHALFRLSSREAIIEYNHRGAKAGLLPGRVDRSGRGFQ